MKGTPIRWLIVFSILMGVCPAKRSVAADAAGGGALVLRPRLIVGMEAVIQAESEMTMKLPTDDLSGDQQVEMAVEHRLNVNESDDENSKLVEIEVTSIRIDMQMPGMAMRYDSRDPASRDAPLGEPFRKLINTPVQMVYDENDEFVKMASTEAFSGGGNSPFGMAIGPDQVKQMIHSSLARGLPEEAVAKGDSWTYTMGMPVAGMGEMDFDLKFIYTKDAVIETHTCAMIDISGVLREDLSGDPGGDEAAERRADTGFESSKITGTVAVDKISRVIHEADTTMDMVLKMPSPLGGEEVLVPIKQQQRSSIISFRQIR